MTTEVTRTKSTNLLAVVVGIAIILFCAAGIAAIMGWIPTSIGSTRETALVADKEKPVKKNTQQNVQPAVPAKVKAPPVQVASSAPVTKCNDCGVIESVREIAAKGEGSGLGAAGGAVVGGLLGHQVGGGSGKQIATVVGAVGGAVAGNEVEKRVKATKSYDITVRLDDGSTRVVNELNAPSWRSGDRVRVVDGSIRAI